MPNSPVRWQPIQKERLRGEFYLSSLLEQGCDTGLISDKQLENVQRQALTLLAARTNRYTGGESSSVKVETAQGILQSIFYTVGLALKSYPDPQDGVEALLNEGMTPLYSRGRESIEHMLVDTRKLLEEVQKGAITSDNYAYCETIQNGIGSFFSDYDPDFGAQETAASIDYPLCCDMADIAGIEYIEKYLNGLLLENKFCRYFDPSEIEGVLKGYDPGYRDLLVNIFERVLARALGCSMLNRDAGSLSLEMQDIALLQKKLESCPPKKGEGLLIQAAKELMEQLSITDSSLRDYILSALPSIWVRIKNAMTNNTLAAVFAVAQKEIEDSAFSFEDGAKMKDETFRQFVRELGTCRTVADKMTMIGQEIHSITDLTDVLEAECLFNEEWEALFGNLGDIELALLMQKVPDGMKAGDLHLTEGEKEWQGRLLSFLDKTEPKRRAAIGLLAERVQISEEEN